ncbi:hypothetical protein [Streptomyces fructofermentans]|uniref:Uncharacterized protein n=1 Tax=Streptomyces fructofermentans TaxID=152141 RepID=A0A918NTB9_9ACTN|nr:hypothetical protein [Streptomyces fructofermentans]GGX93854.1 hypothetical protein GCM10010515_70850 [Streptomyces fructofermentans]
MISTADYHLVAQPDVPGAPAGIGLAVPIRRKRLLREAALPADAKQLLELLRRALDLENDG